MCGLHKNGHILGNVSSWALPVDIYLERTFDSNGQDFTPSSPLERGLTILLRVVRLLVLIAVSTVFHY